MPKPLVIHVLQGVSIIVLLCLMFGTSPARELTRGIVVKAQTPTGQSKEIELYSGYHALIIGAGAYTKGWPRLPNPAKDAREVGESLRTMGWEVEVVTEPDSAILRRELNKLVVGPGQDPSKAVLVWFSGHGHTLEEADGTKLGYIVPVDAPNPDQDLLGFMDKAMSMRNLQTISKQIRSKHVLMAFDSCFSGAIFRLVRAKPSPYIQEKVAYPVREFITAGGEDEMVPDRSIFKTVFLQAVEEGFGDSNQDGYVTGEELGAYVQEQVINYSRQAQHPQFGKINNPKLDKGDFVFVKREVSEMEKLRRELARLRRQNQAVQQENEQLNSLLARMDRLEDKVQVGPAHTVSESVQDAEGTGSFTGDDRYVKDAEGVVWDKKTNLEWVARPDRMILWPQAYRWVHDLEISGGGWRFPTIAELRTLYQKGAGELNITPLLEITGCRIWSGEGKGPKRAWFFDFEKGKKRHCSRQSRYATGYYSNFFGQLRVLAVRSKNDG